MGKLIGYRHIVSKKNGKEYCVATVVSDATAREVQNGVVGQKSEDIFLPEEQLNYLKPEHIGKELLCQYEYSNGRGYLQSVTVK
jgi:hypothetical protein